MHLAALIHQKPYERVEHVLRRHWVTFVPILVLFVLLLAAPITVYVLISSFYPELFHGPVLFPITVLFGSAYLIGLSLFFQMQFIDFYLDVLIITNDRAIDVEQKSLFYRSLTEVDLFRIQDVTANISGPLATFFNFGDVHIKTASNNPDIIAYAVRRPNKIRETLIHLAQEDSKYHRGTLAEEGSIPSLTTH